MKRPAPHPTPASITRGATNNSNPNTKIMLRSLDSGVSALQQFQQEMDVIGNNIANVNTVGFKGASVSFADTFSQPLGSSAIGSMQVGTGVTTRSEERRVGKECR